MRRHIGEERVVVDGLDQPCPEERSRNAKHHVLASDRGAEIRLLKKTARRIVSPGDRKERMHSAVWRTVRIKLESGFAYRTVFPNKRGYLVVRAFFFRHLDLRIDGWTGPSYIRMRVAAGATVQVEARPETKLLCRESCLEPTALPQSLHEPFIKQLLVANSVRSESRPTSPVRP